MGRTAAGVTAIRLDDDDAVTSMEVVEPNGYLLVVTTGGYGKRTPLDEYPVKGRATRGVQTINKNALDSIGRIASARVVQSADDLTMISANGIVLRTKVQAISQSGRSARGVRLMDVGEGNSVASLARIADADLRQVGAEDPLVGMEFVDNHEAQVAEEAFPLSVEREEAEMDHVGVGDQ